MRHGCSGGEQKEVLLLLAVHREVTMSVLHPTLDPVRAAMVSLHSCLFCSKTLCSPVIAFFLRGTSGNFQGGGGGG